MFAPSAPHPPIRHQYRTIARTTPTAHATPVWKGVSTSVLVYEGTAAVTKAAHRRGVLPFSLPYLTELVRPLPTPARWVVSAGIGVGMACHFRPRSGRRFSLRRMVGR